MERARVIHCLHGFLGRPADWDFLPFHHQAPDLHAVPPVPVDEWARRFNEQTGDGDVVIGYSLGGRLALHALLAAAAQQDRRYAAAVIVSAGLGIEGEDARVARLARDAAWAKRFDEEEWDRVLAEWNAQPVFAGHEVARRESDYDRTILSAAVRLWSPAAHEPLESRLAILEIPILWIAGERDDAYVDAAHRAAARLPHAEVWIAPGAGHRVPWQQPSKFSERVAEFLASFPHLP